MRNLGKPVAWKGTHYCGYGPFYLHVNQKSDDDDDDDDGPYYNCSLSRGEEIWLCLRLKNHDGTYSYPEYCDSLKVTVVTIRCMDISPLLQPFLKG